MPSRRSQSIESNGAGRSRGRSQGSLSDLTPFEDDIEEDKRMYEARSRYVPDDIELHHQGPVHQLFPRIRNWRVASRIGLRLALLACWGGAPTDRL